MNTSNLVQSPEPSAPVRLPKAEYVGECTIIDKAEFARLIRQNRGLSVCLFADVGEVDRCVSTCTSVKVPAKQALEALYICSFDAFEWRCSELGTPGIWHYAAPLHLQLRRRRDYILTRISEIEARLARPMRPDADNFAMENRRWDGRQLASDRAELARIEAKLTPAAPPSAVAA